MTGAPCGTDAGPCGGSDFIGDSVCYGCPFYDAELDGRLDRGETE